MGVRLCSALAMTLYTYICHINGIVASRTPRIGQEKCKYGRILEIRPDWYGMVNCGADLIQTG